MQDRALSRQEILFLVGVPLAWAVLLLFHPGGEGTDIYQDLHDKVTRWMVVHVGMMLFIPLFAAAVYVLVRGIEGTAAQVSRIGLVLFVVFYVPSSCCRGSALAFSSTRSTAFRRRSGKTWSKTSPSIL